MTNPKFSTAHSQAVELQRLILNDARNPELKPIVRAGLARAFVELEECKRKLRMKPLPKAIDVEKHRAARAKPQNSGLSTS